MSIKSWIFIAYMNLFSLFLNCGAQAYEQILIMPCNLAIVGNGLAILVCLSAILRETKNSNDKLDTYV